MRPEILVKLFETIVSRKDESPDKSYTARLFSKGDEKILKKIGEESAELLIAGAKDQRREMIYETADVLYHILVLLVHKNISLSEIFLELESRMSLSGLEEKASRKEKP